MGAHFGRLKLSKCALVFLSVLIFSLLQNCLHRDFHYVHLSVSGTPMFVLSGKVNQITANPRHFPAGNVDSTAIFPFFPGKVNHFAANSRHFPPPSLSTPTHTTPNTRPSAPPETGSWLFRKQAHCSSGNKLCPSSLFFYFTFYRLMIIFVGCFGIEIKQICLHLNC